MNKEKTALLCPSLALWDMDGTILDSMRWWRNVLPELVDERKIALPPEIRRELDGISAGRGLDLVTRMMMGEENGVLTMRDIHERMRRHYLTDVAVYPCAVALLKRQREAGTRIVIASATPTEICKEALTHLGLAALVDGYYTTWDAGVGKGDPLYFERALAACKGEISDTVLFEDAYYSVKTAKTLGMRAVVTEDSYQAARRKELYEMADAYFTDGFAKRLK